MGSPRDFVRNADADPESDTQHASCSSVGKTWQLVQAHQNPLIPILAPGEAQGAGTGGVARAEPEPPCPKAAGCSSLFQPLQKSSAFGCWNHCPQPWGPMEMGCPNPIQRTEGASHLHDDACGWLPGIPSPAGTRLGLVVRQHTPKWDMAWC